MGQPPVLSLLFIEVRVGQCGLWAMANRIACRAHACRSTNFDRLIYRSQKSAREYALSGEKRVENKERINPTEDFLRRNTCKKLVRSGIA
jgi:hypothetical protein